MNCAIFFPSSFQRTLISSGSLHPEHYPVLQQRSEALPLIHNPVKDYRVMILSFQVAPFCDAWSLYLEVASIDGTNNSFYATHHAEGSRSRHLLTSYERWDHGAKGSKNFHKKPVC